MTIENRLGNECSLNNGDLNRILTLSNVNLTSTKDDFFVVLDTFYLTENIHYTVTHNSSGTIITFLIPVWDTQIILVNYLASSRGGILPSDASLIINSIERFGDLVTLRVVTDSSYSKWGDAAETVSDTANIRVVVNILNQNESLVKEGFFQQGDKRFFFKSNQENLDRGNRIYHDSKWYEIVEVIPYSLSGIKYSIEVLAKKI